MHHGRAVKKQTQRRALSPRALAAVPVLYRCGTCGSLVLDIDWCLHEEHHEYEAAS